MNTALPTSFPRPTVDRPIEQTLLPPRIAYMLAGSLVAIGLLARLSPLIPDGRLFWQYMTEDGYLMQTIARNIAIGLGMTTAEGTIETNGVQPLATFLFAGMHYLVGGSKAGGIVLVTVLSAAASALAAYFLYRICALMLAGAWSGRQTALLIAALWFAGPLIVPTSMNGLETSVYFASLLGACLYYLSISSRNAELEWRHRLMLGVLLGVTFLARNDAVFFIGALLLVHLLAGRTRLGIGISRRFLDCLVAGATSILIAAPWLVFNYRLFGSIVPISGTAQSHGATLGQNLHLVPAKLFEAVAIYLPLPGALENSLLVAAISLAVLLAVLYGFWRTASRDDLATRRFFLIGILMTFALSSYYGLFFGAPHFLTRYFSILSPFLWTFAVVTFLKLAGPRLSQRLPRATAVAVAMLAVMAAGFAGVAFARGKTHMHKQVVDWVEGNVSESDWVGAVQTGTLGYFHDRTINLDGKVNPAALREIIDHGHFLDYIVESRIDYVVDWIGTAGWVQRSDLSPTFTEQFEVLVEDPDLNLAVVRRVHPRNQ